MTTTTADERLLSAREVADWLGIPVATLYGWRHQGKGPRGARVGKYLRYRSTDVVAWFEAQADPEPADPQPAGRR